MRKVRHKNVVQFIGACTRKPNLCIVFEFMSGGSVYDYMRKVPSLCCSRLMELCLPLSPEFGHHSQLLLNRIPWASALSLHITLSASLLSPMLPRY